MVSICSKCNKSFKTNRDLNKHKNRKKPCDIITDYKCNNCLSFFSSQGNLITHLKNYCTNKKKMLVEKEVNNKMLELKELEAKLAGLNVLSLNNSNNNTINQTVNIIFNYSETKGLTPHINENVYSFIQVII